MRRVRHFKTVLAEDVNAWTSLGWVRWGDEYKQSLVQAVVHLEWAGEGEPRVPEVGE